MLTTDRAVLIRYTRDGQPRRGSGLRVSGRFVLTADHCASGSGYRVLVGGREYSAAVHVRSSDPSVDVAVLEVTGIPPVKPMRCALVDRDAAAEVEGCQALGFPSWKGSANRPLLAQVGGKVPTAEGIDPQAADGTLPLMTLKITDPQARGHQVLPGELDQPGSLWAGMSGAVVVTSDGLVIGVVRSHTLPEGSQSLTVTGLETISTLSEVLAGRFWAALDVRGPRALPVVPLPKEVSDPVVVSPGQVVVGEIPREPVAFVARDTVDRLVGVVGREQVAVVCAVTGLRGVGKTQVAAAYARGCSRRM